MSADRPDPSPPGSPPARRTADQLLAQARTRIERWSPQDAAAAVEQGAVIVDTRCEEDRRREGIIPGAVHAARTVLEWRCDPASDFRDDRIADPGLRLILVCNDGYSSSLAAGVLVDLGFERAGDLIGGFRAWARAGLPVETGW